MSVDERYNFNDPLKLCIIFREPIFKEGEEDEFTEEQLQDLGIRVARAAKNREYNEYAGNIHILWEDIMSIKNYPYKDEWKKFKGDKFYVAVANQGPEYLAYGDMLQIVAYWTLFRNRYPKFA